MYNMNCTSTTLGYKVKEELYLGVLEEMKVESHRTKLSMTESVVPDRKLSVHLKLN
jgi:hypothetical protein